MPPRTPVEAVEEAPELRAGSIGNGEAASGVVDLGATYKMLRIIVPNCAGFDADSTLGAAVAPTVDPANLRALYEENDPETIWAKTPPDTAVSCSFVLTHAYGSRLIRLQLDKVTTADVPFVVVGYGRFG